MTCFRLALRKNLPLCKSVWYAVFGSLYRTGQLNSIDKCWWECFNHQFSSFADKGNQIQERTTHIMEEWNSSLAPMCGSWPWKQGLVHLIGILKNIAKQNFLSNFFLVWPSADNTIIPFRLVPTPHKIDGSTRIYQDRILCKSNLFICWLLRGF